jgi:hypothetical protein
MSNTTKWSSLMLPFFMVACSGQPAPESEEPTMSVQLADCNTGPESLCAALPDLESLVGAVALTYIQTAFSDVNACAIDEYFFPDFLKDGLSDYENHQLIPWLLRFWQCPHAGPEIIPKDGGVSAIGLVPANDPPFTITATDYYMIVNEFLKAVSTPYISGSLTGQCVLGFTQEQIAQMSAMLDALAPQVINDFAPSVGLTHSDPLGPTTCPAYDGPVNILTACVGVQ